MDPTRIWEMPPNMAPPQDTSQPLDKHGTKHVQSTMGSTLYYTYKLWTLPFSCGFKQNCLATSIPTNLSLAENKMLLDFVTTYPDAVILLHASSKMVLWVDSDAVYLVLPNACS